jgi:hypothetical protein
VCWSLLEHAGLGHLAFADAAALRDGVLAWGADPALRAEWRSAAGSVAGTPGGLFDTDQFARRFERALLTRWAARVAEQVADDVAAPPGATGPGPGDPRPG